MRFIAALLMGLMPVLAQADDLEIAPGQTYVVDKNNAQLVLNRLEIGDGAKISFAPGVASWRVQAQAASIGDNVLIDGRGSNGDAGISGVSAESCASQMNGQAGAHGAPGSDGVSVRLQLGVEALGSLKILADGGRGGNGGSGGDGADNTEECLGNKGGDGGAAGDGGVGGNGGSVAVLYRALGADLTAVDMAHRITASSAGGKGGEGGRGGEGGQGGGGKYIKKKTLTGNRQWQAGGESGLSGSPGQSGETGSDGSVMIESLLAQAPLGTEAEHAGGALEKRLRDLERRLKALEDAAR